MDTNEFLKGQRDCKEGKSPERKPTDDYLRGYATQYEHEQTMTAIGFYGNENRRPTKTA